MLESVEYGDVLRGGMRDPSETLAECSSITKVPGVHPVLNTLYHKHTKFQDLGLSSCHSRMSHLPSPEEEAHVLLFEPAGTLNTGDVRDERTVEVPERI